MKDDDIIIVNGLEGPWIKLMPEELDFTLEKTGFYDDMSVSKHRGIYTKKKYKYKKKNKKARRRK